MSESAFNQVLDHADRALARLALQFAQATNVRGIVQAFAEEVQEVEDALFNLQLTRDVDGAEGDVLDLLGALVGAPVRGDRTDYLYRLRIQAQLIINRGSGDLDTIYQVAERIIPNWEPAGATLTEYTGCFEISGTPADGMTEEEEQARELATVLNDVAAGGVRAIVMHRSPDIGGGTAFRFAGGTGSATGFGVGKFRAAFDE